MICCVPEGGQVLLDTLCIYNALLFRFSRLSWSCEPALLLRECIWLLRDSPSAISAKSLLLVLAAVIRRE